MEAAFGTDPLVIREATGLRFTQVVLSPSILLSGALPDEAQAQVVVQVGAAAIPLSDEEAQGIVVNSRWHPLEHSTVREIFRTLERHGAANAQLPLGSYLSLKSDAAVSALIIDNTDWAVGSTAPIARRDFEALGLQVNLYPYQQVGAEYLAAMADRGVGVLLADQMGLGKTAQAIAFLLDQRIHGPSLVVCPASLSRNWAREISSFAPGLSVLTHSGSTRTGVAAGLQGHDVVLTSYETLVSDISFFADIAWNVVVLDEAQLIRNPDTMRSQVVKSLSRRISLALTGTPVENQLLDLWSVAEFVIPALLGTREAFDEYFPDEMERAELLGSIISPVTLRRLVSDVADDLPQLIEVETSFGLSKTDLDRYAEIASTNSGHLAAITALRVLCAHADGFGWSNTSRAAKVEHAMRIIEEAFAVDQKVLVFASFQETLNHLYEEVAATHSSAFLGVVDGRTDASDRQTIVDLFSDFKGAGALLLNPQAAGVGLNITAANHVIHFNPEWNPALTSQATARAYRRKQRLPVMAYHLYYEDTIEEDAVRRAEWKRALALRVDKGTLDSDKDLLG
ncbi:DEAD/DEAH box helicase [Pseudarthrobacter phenanthrenivorans]|uniref:DEAD/DEAH box helicase n=1 Tax=Pseudarthrobacter phenanthrenivorans TaxID=361575 RepID=UPI00344E7F66